MRATRDRYIAGGVIVVLLVLAAVVTGLVLDAQQAGIETRKDFRQREVQRLAATLDARVQQVYSSFAGTYGTPGIWHLTPGDPEDARRLVPNDPQAKAGELLLDSKGVVVNGSLLRDPSVIGRRYQREGLSIALKGVPTFLGVATGFTTTDPVIGITTPVHAADGTLAGVHVFESVVSADSAFAAEVAQLRTGDGATYTYVDDSGIVAASSDPSVLGQRSTLPVDAEKPGFHRRGGRVYAVAEVPSGRWRLVFDQSTKDFEGDLTGPVRGALLVLLLAVVVAGGLSVNALLRRLRAAREEQRRLTDIAAAREEFTSIVSHELRTPVAGLLGFLQTTVDHWDEMSDAERRQAVSRAQQNAGRLQQLTVDVLDSTGIESGQFRYDLVHVDLGEVVDDAVAGARELHGAGRYVVERDDGDLVVEGDPTRLRQVMSNLFDNAVKSSPPDTPVTVTMRRAGNEIEVAVRDRGTGISAEDRERIFDKFVRGRVGLTRGSGLGLYLARQIVQAHGGRIWVGDVEGPGAVVLFTLPAADDDRGR
jgi:signal transduction histidine kinase